MVSAVSVRIFVLPRAPSATDTRAIVAESGASTTFTKSYSPSVAHWWMTLAPSSSTSLLTSRSRSGFAFNVCTPCDVRLERRMYVAIEAPPRSGVRLYSRSLIDVQHRGAENEDRCEHQTREHCGDMQRLPAAFADREEQHQAGEHDRDRQRHERAERVRVIGARELNAAPQRVGIPPALDERSRDGQTDERQPRKRQRVDPAEDPEACDADR